MDYNKMKVNDLKSELAARNLDTKGVKAVLVERLKEAIDKENAGDATESSPTVTAAKKLDVGTPNQSTPVRRSRRRSMTRSPSPAKGEVSVLESVSEEPDQTESSELSSARKKRRTRSITKSPSPVKMGDVKRLEVLEEEPEAAEKMSEVVNPKPDNKPESPDKRQTTPSKQETPAKATGSPAVAPTQTQVVSSPAVTPTPTKNAASPAGTPTKTASSLAAADSPTKPSSSPVVTPTKTKPAASPSATPTTPAKPTASQAVTPAKNSPTPKQADVNQSKESPATPKKPTTSQSSAELASKESASPNARSDLPKDEHTPEKTETAESKVNTDTEDKEKPPTDEKDEDSSKAVKRKSTSPEKESPSKAARTKPALTPIVFETDENEPEVDNSNFALSWFDSDLNLEIDPKTFDAARPVSEGALALVWAGARANLGVTKGKVAYEVILTKANEIRKVTEEPLSSEFRVGWSTSDANLQLGEAKHSFAYASSGSKGEDCKFSDYGAAYKVNDVIGVYLDLDSTKCKVEFTVNNVSQGAAFEFDKADLEGKALFPHICSKNIACKVNFGQLERSLLNDRKKQSTKKAKMTKSAGGTKAEKPAGETKAEKPTEETETDKPAEKANVEKLTEGAKLEDKTDEKSGETASADGKNEEKLVEISKKDDESEEKTSTDETEKSVDEKDDSKESSTESLEKTSEVSKCEEETEQEEEVKDESNTEKKLLDINPEYIYVAKSDKENLVSGACRPESRKDCEVIFLIGMPASGKTHWVQNYLKENPDKRVTVLSVEVLLDQMKVLGVPRQPSNTVKWPRLVDQLSKSLNKLNEIAMKRRRNFILDQTNVFASEQKRRLRGFGEYAARRAIVVVPEEEEYNRRLKLKTDTFGVEVPEGNVNAMKAHFYLPTLEQGWFTEMTYTELDEEKAREMLKKLNEVGRKALPRGFNRNQNQQQQQRGRGGANNNQRWNQGYGNNRYGGQQYQQGGYNPQQRYNNAQQYSQNRNYRPGNGYGRREAGGYAAARYGNNTDWTRNNSGRYDNRYNNRGGGGGYQNNQTRRYDGNRSDYRGYNAWNQQNSNCWSYDSQGNDSQWYSWWQQHGGSGTDNSTQQANMEQYWAQYAQQHNYGNYQQAKSHGSGSSSKNK